MAGSLTRSLWIAAVLSLVVDVATTWYVVSRFGLVAEGNPVMVGVLGLAGVTGLVVVKVAVLAIAVGLPRVIPSKPWAAPLGVVVVTAPVAASNLVVAASVL